MNLRTCWAAGAAVALLSLTAVGCTDPTVAPKSSTTGANVFTDPASYQAFVARIYAGLAVSGQQGGAGNPDILGIDEGFSQYLRLYWEHEELPTDEVVIGWGDIGLPEMNLQTWSSSSTMVVAMYYRIFFQVTLANEFLRQTISDSLTARGNVSAPLRAQIQQYRAEARFLRALSYWHAIDLFGNVPLVTEADPIGTVPAQSTRAALYNYVVSELTALKDSLPPANPSNYGRATPPAVDMLLAELYLNAGVYTGTPHYDLALAAASAVIAGPFTLDTSYRNLFQADNNLSPEIIFAVTQDGKHTQTYGGMTFLVHASCGGSMNANTYAIDYCWGGIRLKPEAYNLFAAGDKRGAYFFTTGQKVAIDTISNFRDGIAAPKFTNIHPTGIPNGDPQFVDTDFPMFRLGEAYLIYAEANLRGGGGSAATALGYLNALRERAYGNTTADFAALPPVDSILAERGRELLWEAHRRTDLVRFGLFTGGTYLWAWKGGVQGGASTPSYVNLYPLPASELIVNPKLTQNTGY
jgi:starch-binding outer membrane protein, SusD/RagB family